MINFIGLLEVVEIIKFFMIIIFGTQFAHGLTVLILEKTMLNYFVFSIFFPPETFFQKLTNIMQYTLVGSSYFIYTKIGKYNWFVRKILFAVILFLQGVCSIIVYHLIAWPLDALVVFVEE
ncbi:hypothetical protein VL12_14600 [Rossellomorea marisflavi]|nr:hypothetical protein VL12_14600 [Rossellomorea marisflavi]